MCFHSLAMYKDERTAHARLKTATKAIHRMCQCIIPIAVLQEYNDLPKITIRTLRKIDHHSMLKINRKKEGENEGKANYRKKESPPGN